MPQASPESLRFIARKCDDKMQIHVMQRQVQVEDENLHVLRQESVANGKKKEEKTHKNFIQKP
jgi:hypothetical protein